jgi:hypothetical protein
MSNKIGVVELDEIERIGRLAALGAAGCNVVDAASPDEASTWSEKDWMRFDVLLFGVVADDTHWDRFESIRTARRAHLFNPNLRIVALCGSRVRPLVHVRLAQAGAHRMCSARRARTIDDLARLVSADPHEADRGTVLGFDVRGAVVGPRTDPSAVLDHVVENELDEVFDNAETQAETGLSRRSIIRLRREIAEIGDLSVPSGYATGGPYVDRSLPSWRSIVSYVNRARGLADVDVAAAGMPLRSMSLTA